MKVQHIWKRIVCFWKQLFTRNTLQDTASIKLLGLEIQVNRELPKNIPYELTVVIPRVEYRINTAPSPSDCPSWEILLNSITIAHSPRHEPVDSLGQ